LTPTALFFALLVSIGNPRVTAWSFIVGPERPPVVISPYSTSI
jgi:hypothetical protein